MGFGVFTYLMEGSLGSIIKRKQICFRHNGTEEYLDLRVMIEEIICKILESVRVVWREESSHDLINGLLQLSVSVVVLLGIVPIDNHVVK